MTTKMTRRTFLKGAAAAAAAVSLSGLLTGCGGDQLADNEVQNGAVAVLTITINGIPGVLYLVKRDGRYVATKIKPMN